jgi:hypothetical protein
LKTFIASVLLLFCFYINTWAQTQPYGKIDIADLKMPGCDFEKDANAMILFNKCSLRFDMNNIFFEHHIRLKIFNLNAVKLADIRIGFTNNKDIMAISNLRAETINLNGDKVEITKVDKKSIYKQKVDKWESEINFSFPAVKAGSVLEYSYEEQINFIRSIPDWYFQGGLPVRYSECNISVPKLYTYKLQLHTSQPLVKNADTVIAMENIPSLQKEPFMDSYTDNLQ